MSPWDEAVWRAIDGATVLQQGSHFPGRETAGGARRENGEEMRKRKSLKCPNCLTAGFVEAREKMEERREKREERRETRDEIRVEEKKRRGKREEGREQREERRQKREERRYNESSG